MCGLKWRTASGAWRISHALVAFVAWLLAATFTLAADAVLDVVERGAFEAAAKAFQDFNYERAEREFAEFVRVFPESSLRSEATLLQARARFSRTNAPGAIDLLTAGLPRAGQLADQYQFWLGEARLEAGQFAKAAEAYGMLVRDFTNSPHRFAAAHHEALARFRLGEHSNVVALLRAPDGAFQRAANASPTNALAIGGTLLLGESLLVTRDHVGAEQAARGLLQRGLTGDAAWRGQYLLGRVLLAANRPAEALNEATNLVRRAEAPALRAEAFALHGAVLEKLGDLPGAVNVFTNNFSTNAPAELRQRALAKVVDLGLAQTNRTVPTIALLEQFSAEFPADAAQDFVQRWLGDLKLREAQTLTVSTNTPAARTNLVLAAVTNLNRVVLTYTNSPFRPEAIYLRGWCRWELDQPADAAMDFALAAQRLPRSEEQAIARFKLAEAQARLRDFTNAIRNFALVAEQYDDLERVRKNYFDQALFQQMLAAVAVTNLPVAEAAIGKLLATFPDSPLGERGLLRFGTELNRLDRPAQAREKLQLLLGKFIGSTNAPQVQLAIAGTYRREFDWTNTVRALEEWVRRYPGHAALPEVEFQRAWFTEQAGGTNALALFTNYVARFPAHSNAPLAQLRIADFHFSQGAFDTAEASYQLVFQNTNGADVELKSLARLNAGRSAFSRRSYRVATNYFVALVNDERVPRDVQAQAFFALGDTYLTASQAGEPIATDPFGDAINAFSRITNNFATNRQAAFAMGKIGDCHLQRAGKSGDAKELELAAGAYQRALTWPGAEAEARLLAEFALGDVRAKQNRPAEAAEHWSNLLYLKTVRPEESPDPELVREAGLALARLRESQSDWAAARQIYVRLQQMFPVLRGALQEKVDRAQKRLNERP